MASAIVWRQRDSIFFRLSIVFIDPPEAIGPYGSATMTKMVVGATGADHTSNGFKRESVNVYGHTGVETDNALRSLAPFVSMMKAAHSRSCNDSSIR